MEPRYRSTGRYRKSGVRAPIIQGRSLSEGVALVRSCSPTTVVANLDELPLQWEVGSSATGETEPCLMTATGSVFFLLNRLRRRDPLENLDA